MMFFEKSFRNRRTPEKTQKTLFLFRNTKFVFSVSDLLDEAYQVHHIPAISTEEEQEHASHSEHFN